MAWISWTFYSSQLYEEIATQAITGGYDKTAGVTHYYQGETEDVVDQEALSYYQQFAEANPDSRLGQLVQEYVTLLQENQFQINEELENFYRSIPQRLQPATEEGQTGATQENGSAAQNGNNGTVGTQDGTTNTQNGNTGAANDSTIGGSVAGTVKDAVDNVMDGGR